MSAQPAEIISPQAGPQTQFLSSRADIVIYGGAAGGGKSWGLLAEPLRHTEVRNFSAVVFRRKTVDITNPGGLWDESYNLYPAVGGKSKETPRFEWSFPSGAKVRFAHLEHDKNKLDWQGAQVPLLCFDELTHFEETQFWYLLSRNRSACGVKPYVRCTTNPDADSWVANLVDWWIDPSTGYAIPERSGIVRWFVRMGESLIWGEEPEDLLEYTDDTGMPIPPKSFTFIPSSLGDNQILMEIDPGYRANLMALGTVERERLLKGNWKIRPAAGLYFQKSWIKEEISMDALPSNLRLARGWDLAATEDTGAGNVDWTCGTKMGISPQKTIFVIDHVFHRYSPGKVKKLLKETAEADGIQTQIAVPQDPGQAGKSQSADLARTLVGFNCRFKSTTGDKITRFSPFSAQAEAGNVVVVKGPWNDRWYSELENFPPIGKNGHDDDADSTSAAFEALYRRRVIPLISKYYMA